MVGSGNKMWMALALLGLGCTASVVEPRSGAFAGTDDPPGMPTEDGMMPLPPEGGPGGVDACGDVRGIRAVYFGTARPTHVPLTDGQILAVGKIGGCSGTLITDTWVLTARHCGLSRSDRFCMGTDPARPSSCVSIARVINHRSSDSALVELSRPAREVMAGVEPVPLFMGRLDSSWIGRRVELAGYGQNERGGYGVRAFTAQPLIALRGDMVSTDGEGRHGVCYGDSGGPMFVIADDGSVRVAGSLTGGDGSCVGVDEYTRVDTYRDWMLGYTGAPPAPPMGEPPPEEPPPAEPPPAEPPPAEPPPAEPPPAEPPPPGTPGCGDVDLTGRCEGSVAVWCEGGVLRERDCGVCGEVCDIVREEGGAYCRRAELPPGEPPPEEPPPGEPPPGEPPGGDGGTCPIPGDGGCPGGDPGECGPPRCAGDVLSWPGCDGSTYEFDCSWLGARCDYVAELGMDLCTWW